MKKLSYFLIAIIFSSCVTQQSFPLLSKYQDTPFVVYSDKSKDEVWSKVIDIFAQKGLPISVIDKSSGLIGSNEYQFANSMTHETMSGFVKDTTAWIVVNRYTTDGTNTLYPNTVKGSFNVRIKEEGSKTSININLVGLTAWYLQPSANMQIPYEVKSTGVFERTFAELVK